jgi:hypothetical protein
MPSPDDTESWADATTASKQCKTHAQEVNDRSTCASISRSRGPVASSPRSESVHVAVAVLVALAVGVVL